MGKLVFLAVLAAISCSSFANDTLTATPIVDNCLDISAVIRCNDAGRASIEECGDDDTIAVFTEQRAAEDGDGIDPARLLIGDQLVSDCTSVDRRIQICDVDRDLRGTFRASVRQLGFFFPTDPASEVCEEGLTVTL
jgi:hypothetical protein